jgi:hypothetical protein
LRGLLEDLPNDFYTSGVDSQEAGDFSTARAEESPEPPNPTFVGKLKLYCPSLYFSLSAWERDHLDSTFLPDLIPSPVADLGTFLRLFQRDQTLLKFRVESTPVTVTTQETGY